MLVYRKGILISCALELIYLAILEKFNGLLFIWYYLLAELI